MNATMKNPGWEIIAAICVLIMTTIAIVLTVAYHNVALAIIVVFIGTYVLISTERMNRTAMALLGMSLAGFIFWVAMEIQILVIDHPFEVLIAEIEWTTIIFIIAMSMIVSVAAASGLFQFIALKIAARSKGERLLGYSGSFLVTRVKSMR